MTDIRTFADGTLLAPPAPIEADTLPKSQYQKVSLPKMGAKKAESAVIKGGAMPTFTTLKGIAAALDIQNVDTDMIIPKVY